MLGRTDPMPHVHTKEDPRVFVFGSNLRGIHGAGAARYAYEELGAEWGIAEGPTGRAYALPTCALPGVPLDLNEVRKHVDVFLAWARLHPETRFFVSEVGCGFAGFTAAQISPLFACWTPRNCDLPPGWRITQDEVEKRYKEMVENDV